MMQRLAFVSVIFISSAFTACKQEPPQHTEKVVTADGTAAPKTEGVAGADSGDQAPSEQKKPSKEDPVPEVLPAGPAPAPAFPYVMEFPKEAIEPGSVYTNSCPFVAGITQNGNRLTVNFTANYGGLIEPGSAVTVVPGTGGSPDAYVGVVSPGECAIWGRIKNVPAGYRMRVSMVPGAPMKISANLKAADPANYVVSDLASWIFSMGMSGWNPADVQSGSLYYNTIGTGRLKQIRPGATDVLNKTELTAEEHGPYVTSNGPADTCPTIAHEVRMPMRVSGYAGIRVQPTRPTVPNDGFRHFFYMKSLPELQFTLEKCN